MNELIWNIERTFDTKQQNPRKPQQNPTKQLHALHNTTQHMIVSDGYHGIKW